MTTKTTPELHKLAYSLPELSAAVGMSISAIRNEMDAGNLVPSYPNSKPIFPRTEVERWLEAMPTEPRRAS